MGLIACSLTACFAELTQEDIERAGAEAEGEVAEAAAALSGTVYLDGLPNCGGQAERVRSLVSSAAVFADTAAFNDCLARSIPSYDEWSFPEQIKTALGRDVTTHISCLDTLTVAGQPVTARGYYQSDGSEKIQLSVPAFAATPDPVAIGLFMHEVSHNRGFNHPTNTSSPDYSTSYPEHILECARTIFSGSAARPRGTTRYDFQTETTLAPVGGVGGGPIVKTCGTGRRMAGLRANWGSEIVALGARCRSNPNATPVLDFGIMGGTHGTPANLDCAFGEVVVGVHGSANDRVLTRIGPICARITDVQNGAAGPENRAALRFRTPAGNASGYDFERICPTRMVAEQLRGRAGAGVDRLELYCQRIDRITRVAETVLAKRGSSTGGVPFSDRCAGRSAMVGLTYDKDWALGRLGGECTELSRACFGTTCFEVATNGSRHVLGSHGGGTFVPANEVFERCPQDQALVGLNTMSGLFVDAVGGICAPIAPWSLPASIVSAPTTPLNVQGGTGGGALPALMCPRQSFLVGWELRSSSLVESVQPVCRRFD